MLEDGVCVYCLTYNHINYIRDALNGFVDQKVDFPYYVIVHDDASTDGTAEIVKEYSEKYPDIIKPILQKENQYSKGIDIYYSYIKQYMKSKYIAICEGDDYWINPNKIKKQYDYMQKNPDISLCVHNTLRIKANGEEIGNLSECIYDREYSVEEIIKAGGGGLFHTSSYMVRNEMKNDYPQELIIPGIGDYSLAIYSAIMGRVFYFKEVMSVYRTDVENGWTKRLFSSDQRLKQYLKNMSNYFDSLDRYTQFKYKEICEKERIKYDQELVLMTKNLGQMIKDEEICKILRRMPMTERMRTYKRFICSIIHIIRKNIWKSK